MIGMTEITAGPLGVAESASVYKGDGVGASWFYDGVIRPGDEAVRTETLLRQGTVWAGVNLIAGDIGQIPFTVRREVESGEEPAPNHPIARLLRDGPNEWQTIDQWLEWMTATSIVWGNAVSEIQKDRAGNVVALHPLPPIFLDWNAYEGEPYYYFAPPDGEARVLRTSEVIHLRTLSTTGFWGLRLAEVAYSELTLEKSAKLHAANVFRQGAIPGGVLQHPGKLSKESRADLRDEWYRVHGGGSNAGRTAVLWEGMTYNPTMVTPADSQMIEVLSHDAVLVGKVLGVSPYFLGDLRHNATRANLEEESKQYYGRTLRRRVLSLEKELQRKLIRAPVYRVRADPTEFLKGDLATQAEVAKSLVEGRLWSRNEGRKYLGSQPVEGGDVFENPNIDTNATANSDNDSDEAETLAAARRIRRLEASRLANAAETSRDFVGLVAKFYDKLGEMVADQGAVAGDGLAVYAEGRKAKVLAMADTLTPAEMAESLRSEPIEADARALASYLTERENGND